MTTSWIEKNLSNNPFIYIENGEYSFKDFFELLIEYYNFSSEIIDKNEKITFISKSVLQYSIFSNLIPMLGGIFVPMNPKSPIDEITKKMNIIGSKKIIYDESIELEKLIIYLFFVLKNHRKVTIDLLGLLTKKHFVFYSLLEALDYQKLLVFQEKILNQVVIYLKRI